VRIMCYATCNGERKIKTMAIKVPRQCSFALLIKVVCGGGKTSEVKVEMKCGEKLSRGHLHSIRNRI
jgi:hypothetical protein